ncbi:hypothetical protein M405DRAFT_821767 [Rhizopogon salebrosus TDB-379]|nr:hypothetical protein M405DRAFT_821767 [Rhizopogon salebrosus TDB-379]
MASTTLLPATDDVFDICPRFRILVIGKTGVGKSSLIERAFGVKHDLSSNLERDEANIDTEIISPQHDRFVLHSSKGFDPGEEDNVNIVHQFIERREKMPDLRDRLHAVWLCFETPRTGGSLEKTGMNDFLKLRHAGKLGHVPIIVVFTKYDMLVDQVDYELGPSLDELSDDAITELVKERAETKLQEICIRPLGQLAGSDILHVTVSIKDGYKESLSSLIQMTEQHVRRHVAGDASVMASVAQRVDQGSTN